MGKRRKISFINRNMTPRLSGPNKNRHRQVQARHKRLLQLAILPTGLLLYRMHDSYTQPCKLQHIGKYIPLSPIILDYKTGIIWGGLGGLFFGWLGGGNTIFAKRFLFVSTLKSK